MSLDVWIVVLLSAIMPLVLGVLMAVYWHSRKTYRGFGFWVLANFAIGLGYILLLLRTQIPDFFSIIVGNVLTLYGLILIYDGIQLFFERRGLNLWNQFILAACLLGQLYLTYINPNINARIELVSATAFLLELRIGITLFHHPPPNLRQTSWTIAIIFFAAALISILRAVYALYQPQPIDFLSDVTLVVSSFGLLCAITVWSFYFFFLNTTRLEFDLHHAQHDLSQVADADRHRVIQLNLLDETSGSLAESIDELEIMQRAVKAIVKRFGYAIASISLLVEGDILEVAAIDGVEDVGFKPGFRQKIGEGIIGRTAELQSVYISGDVEHDPYYFTIGRRSGSAMCVPMLDEGQLLGVLYVESTTANAFNQDDIQMLDTLVRHMVTAIQKARLYARSQAQLRTISAIQSVSQTIHSSLDLQQIFQSVVQLLKDTFNYTFVSIYTLHGQVLRLGAQAGYPAEMIISEIPATTGITGRCVQTKQIQFIRDVANDPAFLRAAQNIESEICVPIVNDDQVLGVLNVEAAPGHPLTDDDVTVLTSLVGPVVIAIENAHLHAEVKQLALTDGLTHLFNRRAFDQQLENELYRAVRYIYPMSLIIIDMDFFKEFNDQWGHPAGDERLKAVAELLRSGLRNPDFIARYGGEEFALILPNTTKSNALVLAERLRAAAEMLAPEKTDQGAPISGYTFSMGVATFPDDGQTIEELLFAADQAELTAKKLGKNRIYTSGNGL